MRSSISSRLSDVASALLVDASESDRAFAAEYVCAYPTPLLERLVAAECRIRPLARRERYRDASPALQRLGIDVDGWPVSPAGLFVVEESAVYLRSTSPMTVCHEAGHALDCALGGGIYRSSSDRAIRRAFSDARGFVTPYAASALDEYFAENIRAFVGANDAASLWPTVSPERLKAIDPAMFEIVAAIFADLAERADCAQISPTPP